MRYRIYILSLSLFLIVMLALSADLALAQAAPLHPGQDFYDLQLWAEQSLVTINPDPASRAAFSLDLLQRRLDDLTAVAVCCCNDSRSSLSRRVFSMAMTAWLAKFAASSICFWVNGRTSCR